MSSPEDIFRSAEESFEEVPPPRYMGLRPRKLPLPFYVSEDLTPSPKKKGGRRPGERPNPQVSPPPPPPPPPLKNRGRAPAVASSSAPLNDSKGETEEDLIKFLDSDFDEIFRTFKKYVRWLIKEKCRQEPSNIIRSQLPSPLHTAAATKDEKEEAEEEAEPEAEEAEAEEEEEEEEEDEEEYEEDEEPGNPDLPGPSSNRDAKRSDGVTTNGRSQTAQTFEILHIPGTKKRSPSPINMPRPSKYARRRPVKRWSVLEEDTLRECVKKLGRGNWKLILSSYPSVFVGRTEVDLKDKWRNLTR